MHRRVASEWQDVDVGDKAMGLYVCAPEDGASHPAVVVLQEIFGVNHHIRGLTERTKTKGGILVSAPRQAEAPVNYGNQYRSSGRFAE